MYLGCQSAGEHPNVGSSYVSRTELFAHISLLSFHRINDILGLSVS